VAEKNTAVFGIYESANYAERAVDRIIEAGFSNNDISVLLPDAQSSKEFAHEKNTKAPEGTAAGVTTGGLVGGTLGLMAGIGTLAIPGLGFFPVDTLSLKRLGQRRWGFGRRASGPSSSTNNLVPLQPRSFSANRLFVITTAALASVAMQISR
jgi:hypothetical protein